MWCRDSSRGREMLRSLQTAEDARPGRATSMPIPRGGSTHLEPNPPPIRAHDPREPFRDKASHKPVCTVRDLARSSREKRSRWSQWATTRPLPWGMHTAEVRISLVTLTGPTDDRFTVGRRRFR